MRFVVIEGTSREGRKSIHPARYAVEKLEDKGHEADLFDVKQREIPFLGNRTYIEDENPVPEDVREFGELVENADCVVIVSPEYNHSIPGALKNALDHLYPEYEDKPFGYITVSAGGFGGIRALDHLQDITLGLGGVPGPSLQVSNVSDVFGTDGELLDESYRERFEVFIEEAERFAKKIK
ncbi:MAG: NADPH-dependent FMN reductase [Candidatus Nanohaloarchaea archaeon]